MSGRYRGACDSTSKATAMISLRAGEASAAFDERRGARLTSLVAAGAERIVQEHERPPNNPTLWGSFVMAPWAGRLENATLEWEGERHSFSPNLGPHAIHGLVIDTPWEVEGADAERMVVSCPLGPRGWPFGGVVRQRAALAPGSLELILEIEAHERAMPVAVGWHPWWRRPSAGDARVAVLSEETLETRADLIPTGSVTRVAGERDLGGGPELGARRLDHVYVNARSPASIVLPDLSVEIAFDPPLHTVVVYTPPEGICVEPQSAWPDAVNLAARGAERTGCVSLGAGEKFSARTVWSWKALTP